MANPYQNSVGSDAVKNKNRNDQKIKQMPAGVKRFHAPAPEHKPAYVHCEGQKIKSMPPVTHYVGGGGSSVIHPRANITGGQKIR